MREKKNKNKEFKSSTTFTLKTNVIKSPKSETGVETKFDVPIYDPMTGELNPYYEKLTGKPNPLLDKNKKGVFLIPTLQQEPKRKNRFIVTFPDKFNIKPYSVKSITRPNIIVKEKRFWGFKYGVETIIEPTELEVRDFISFNVGQRLRKLIDSQEIFTYTLEMLDPVGDVVERFKYSGCVITSLDFGLLDYSSKSELATINVVIKADEVEF